MMEMKGMSAMPNPNTGFLLKCGKCKDPCALRWYPEDMMDMMEEHEEEAKEGRIKIIVFITSCHHSGSRHMITYRVVEYDPHQVRPLHAAGTKKVPLLGWAGNTFIRLKNNPRLFSPTQFS